MKQLFMKQKVFSLGEKFTIQDRAGDDVYVVEGSFMKVPKTFVVYDIDNRPTVKITKKMLSLLPKFCVEVEGEEVFAIEKRLTAIKSKYVVEGNGLTIQGDWWDMNFDVMRGYRKVAKVRKRWISWGDSYELTIFETENEAALIGLIAAIDFVKQQESAAANSVNA
ncbi:MAG: LURP-one-related/scramblase family protein [Vagococcus sp.]